MIFDLGKRHWLVIAAIVTALAAALWALGVVPWWAVLLAVPIVTFAVGALLVVIGILAWIAGGSR